MILDQYLNYLKSRWWVHICFDVWLQIFVLAFILYGLCTLNKRRTLRKKGKLVQALVIDKFLNESEDSDGNVYPQYWIKYIFTDINPKLLIYGYIKSQQNHLDLLIPSQIIDLISKFHGLNKYDFETASIIEQEQLDLKIWNMLCIGDKIDILFDPKHPKMIQIPKMKLMKYGISKISKGYKIICWCSLVFLLLLLLWYYILMDGSDDDELHDMNAGIRFFTACLLFLTYCIGSLIAVVLCYGCYGIKRLRVHQQMNSSFMHAKYRQVYNNDVMDEQITENEGEEMTIMTMN